LACRRKPFTDCEGFWVSAGKTISKFKDFKLKALPICAAALYRKSFAALSPAALKNGTTIFGSHALAKAVFAFALYNGRYFQCLFHGATIITQQKG